MEYLNIYYGLVTDNDPTTENGILFLAEYYLLCEKIGVQVEHLDYYFNMYEKFSKVESGLFNRNKFLTTRTQSHDNLSAIFTLSYLMKTTTRFEIWKYLLKHLGIYDNTKGKSTQLSRFLPFNPSNFFIWGLCAESNIYLLSFPLYLISLIITCYKDSTETSGKLLSWVELYPHKKHWLVKHLFNYYEKKMKKQYGDQYIKELCKVYFGTNAKEFPINKVLGI